jgi:aminoglycoside phosphotransferase (APT) family kinase protein
VPPQGPWPPGSAYVKRRGRAAPGSIPEALDLFRAEIRFYREIAPVAGIRVPACYRAEETGEGTVLVLEDLSAWRPGADPVAAARVLAGLHREWASRAASRWPWLRPAGAAADLVQDLFDRTWPRLAARGDLTPPVAALGARLVGRVVEAESAVGRAGPATLVHGDAATRNMCTGPGGEVALLDWEDVSAAPGVLDLAWLLVSSAAPERWDEVIAAYGPTDGLADVLPAIIVQGLLSLRDIPDGSGEAGAWIRRLEAAGARLEAVGTGHGAAGAGPGAAGPA